MLYSRFLLVPILNTLVCIRKWQCTTVFLPGKSHGQRNLAGYSPSGHKRVTHDLVTKQQQEIVYKLQGQVQKGEEKKEKAKYLLKAYSIFHITSF